jgi:hypothetical protein
MLRVKILTATENRQKFKTSIVVFRTFLLYEGTEKKKRYERNILCVPSVEKRIVKIYDLYS